MPTLVLTINGPFAYVDNFPQRGYMTLMAPMCPQHLGGFLASKPKINISSRTSITVIIRPIWATARRIYTN
jgi:hypothetical protein